MRAGLGYELHSTLMKIRLQLTMCSCAFSAFSDQKPPLCSVVCFFLASPPSENRGEDVQFLLKPAPWIAHVETVISAFSLPSSDPFAASCSLSSRKYFQESQISLMSS